MNFTTTLTAKNQLTLPKVVIDSLGLKIGTKIDIFPASDGGFSGRPRRKSTILEFGGAFSHLDDGREWNEVREEAEKLSVREWIADKRPYDKNRSR